MTHTLPWQTPARNYYPLPKVLCQLGLSPGEIAVYSFLMYCENRTTYQCYPSYRTIGEAVGMSRNTVAKYVRQLEEKGLKPGNRVKHVLLGEGTIVDVLPKTFSVDFDNSTRKAFLLSSAQKFFTAI